MKGQDTNKEVSLFNYNDYVYLQANNRIGTCFRKKGGSYDFYENGYVYPKKDLTSVEKMETTSIKPGSKLYFDSGSSFPRFKLTISDNKRCIKIDKGDYIVVSGNKDFKGPSNNYIVLEDDDEVYLVNEDELNSGFYGNIQNFISSVSPYKKFSNVKQIYKGRLASYAKDSVYGAKYANGDYTVPFIKDDELDKIICNMCPDPTYDEIMSIVDMLDSEDASVVQLGVKMITGFNVDKYRLTFRLILNTRKNGYVFTQNTVGTKQLVDTLRINPYGIGDDFGNYCGYAEKAGETYTVEDIAMAKQVSIVLIRKGMQNQFDRYFKNNKYKGLPDETRVKIE